MTQYTLITGASSGIGYEFAKVCAENKHNLILIARSSQKLQELKSQLEKEHPIQIHLISKDLSHPSAPQEIFDEIKHLDLNVEILINNAGFGNHGPFQTTDWQTESDMIQVNVTTLTHLTKLFLPSMIENNSGKILTVASTAAFFPGPYMAIYYATKAFVLSFSESLAEELADTNVTVTCLAPGQTQSNFQNTAQLRNARMFQGDLPTAQQLAQYGYRELMNGTRVAVYGYLNKAATILANFIPRTLRAKIVKRVQK